MLATKSKKLTGSETFEEAFALMPKTPKVRMRYLFDEKGEATDVYQYMTKGAAKWSSPRTQKRDSKGDLVPMDFDAKSKLQNAGLFYETYDQPSLVGSNNTHSWMLGNLTGCNLLGDDYNVQGIIISSIFDPLPRYYISFERIFCENQFSTLGKNNASMYIDMNAFLTQAALEDKEAKAHLHEIIGNEVEKRIADANKIYDKLATTHLTDEQIDSMFAKLTIDTVSKNNEEAYNSQVERYERFKKVYNLDDNQNFKGSLFGFVNAYTNIRTRESTNPLDAIKPVLPAEVVNNPMNFEYIVRNALVTAK